MRKLVILEQLSDEHISQIKNIAKDFSIFFSEDDLNDAEIIFGWSDKAADICLRSGSSLRWVHTWAAGVNTLPLTEFEALGIFLTNSSGVHAKSISETVFAMMLSFTRGVHTHVRNQISKNWSRLDNLSEIHSKTIGILGVGAIGEEIACLSKAFKMNVLGYRRTLITCPFVDKMYQSNLDEMLSQCDYVVNILPLTANTVKMIGHNEFKSMKDSAFYINVGRGETTDTTALIEALTKGYIAGAGLDVFEEEPLPYHNLLWEFENVIITPHNSGATQYYNERVMDIINVDLADYVRGEKPSINLVDYNKGY